LTSSTTSPNVNTTIKVKIGAQSPGSAQVAKPTGQVTIKIDGVNKGTFDLNNGFFNLNLPFGLSAGQHKFVVTYSGDGNFLGGTFTAFLTFGSR
jgi:Big-like domain-containing protein